MLNVLGFVLGIGDIKVNKIRFFVFWVFLSSLCLNER